MPGLRDQPTQILVSMAADGNKDARDLLVQRLVPKLEAWARGRLPAYARRLKDTQDVVAEVLTRSVTKLEGFEEHGGGFLGYVQKGILNQVRTEVRRARTDPTVNDVPELPALERSALEELIDRDDLHRYERALGSLGAKDQELIRARVELNMTYQEVALHAGKPSSDAARMAVKRALGKLAQAMSHAHEP